MMHEPINGSQGGDVFPCLPYQLLQIHLFFFQFQDFCLKHLLLDPIVGIHQLFDVFQPELHLLIEVDEPDPLPLRCPIEQIPIFVFPDGATSPAFS